MGSGGCCELRSHHCTPAWATRAKLSKKKERKKERKRERERERERKKEERKEGRKKEEKRKIGQLKIIFRILIYKKFN